MSYMNMKAAKIQHLSPFLIYALTLRQSLLKALGL